jgi:hypothetical protein
VLGKRSFKKAAFLLTFLQRFQIHALHTRQNSMTLHSSIISKMCSTPAELRLERFSRLPPEFRVRMPH